MSSLKDDIQAFAKQKGVDIIGFASVDRFDKLPEHQHPKTIMAEAKTVIGLGFRVLRGAFRGIEDGSTYYQYTTMGIEVLEESVMPSAMLDICGFVEDYGYVCVPQKKQQLIKREAGQTNPEMSYQKIYESPDHINLNFTHAALACGMGELGMSGQILTDDFGPMQRFCFIITDAEIEPDALYQPHLCDQCGACQQACSGKALGTRTVYPYLDVTVYEVFRLNPWQCSAYTQGANMHINPFMPKDALRDIPDRLQVLNGEKQLTIDEAKQVMDELVFYPPFRHGYATSICGRACDRACYAHLEEKGVLKRKFVNPFRKRGTWTLDLIAE